MTAGAGSRQFSCWQTGRGAARAQVPKWGAPIRQQAPLRRKRRNAAARRMLLYELGRLALILIVAAIAWGMRCMLRVVTS